LIILAAVLIYASLAWPFCHRQFREQRESPSANLFGLPLVPAIQIIGAEN
jgi:hypothetical protein